MRGLPELLLPLLLLGSLDRLTRPQVAAAAPGVTLGTDTATDTTDDLRKYGLNGRIVNGRKASLRQFPHQISLRRSYNMRHFCGGALISERYVLSAAHCMFLEGVKIQPWTIVAVAGDLKLNKQSSTGQKKGVDKFFVHPKFVYDTLHNDVAILKIKVPFTLTLEVSPAPLSHRPPLPDTFCEIAGWGYPSEEIEIPTNDLMYVDLPILPVATCRKLLVNYSTIPEGMYCAGYVDGGKDACQGDSGGPMTCGNILTGVISGGEGCARPSLPGVYTDVSYYLSWITQHTSITLM